MQLHADALVVPDLPFFTEAALLADPLTVRDGVAAAFRAAAGEQALAGPAEGTHLTWNYQKMG